MPTTSALMDDAHKHYQAGNVQLAEQLCQRVIEADPGQIDALNMLGAIASRMKRPQEAIGFFQRTLAARPNVPELHCNLAAAYKAAGNVRSAIDHLQMALRLRPDHVSALLYLGDLLVSEGQFEEAAGLCRQALQLKPDSVWAFKTLAGLAAEGYHSFSDTDVGGMQAILAGGQLPPETAAQLAFALATHWDNTGDYNQAFFAFRQANGWKREFCRQQDRVFDSQAHRAYVDRIIAAFPPEAFEGARPSGSDSDRPVFVVGMPRSGTSLVEQILASHPMVFGAGELEDVDQIAAFLSERFNSAGGYPECRSQVDAETLRASAEGYLLRLSRLNATAARVIDKMPHNFLHLGLIAALFPNARIIHCRRDPMDTCFSAYCRNTPNLPHTASLEDLGFYYREYQRLMEHWARVLPAPVHEVTYEELVGNQEAVSRGLVEFLGLTWDARCLEFHKTVRTVKTASKLQVRQPIYTHAIGRWKRYEAHLEPLRKALAEPEAEAAPPAEAIGLLSGLWAEASRAHESGRFPRAESLCRQILQMDPDQPDALNLLGLLGAQAGKPRPGMQLIQRAVALRPADPLFHLYLGRIHQVLGDVAAAVNEFQEALRLDPGSARAHTALGDVFVDQRQLEPALAHALDSRRLKPDLARNYSVLGKLTELGRYAFADEDLRRMNALLADVNLGPGEAAAVAFALADHWDRQGNHDEAFRHYQRANDLKLEAYRRSNQRFNREKHLEQIDAVIAAFTPEFLERVRPFGSDSERPVFVFGMPHSGVHLAGETLGRHPLAYDAGERERIRQVASTLPFHLKTETRYPACVAALDRAAAEAAATAYLAAVSGANPTADRVVDRLPHNFLHLGLIVALFPKARLIHCRRDPMDLCLSAYVRNYSGLRYSCSVEQLGFFHRHYERLMDYWRRTLPVPIHEVCYEELVTSPEPVVRRLLDFCGLPWDDRCLAFLQASPPQPVELWKRYAAHLEPLLQALTEPG